MSGLVAVGTDFALASSRQEAVLGIPEEAGAQNGVPSLHHSELEAIRGWILPQNPWPPPWGPFLSSSLPKEQGEPSKPSPPAAGSRGAACGTPEGRQANGKRAEVHTPTPKPHVAELPGGGCTASRREPTPPGRLPAPPRRRPHPQSFRRPSAHPPRRRSGRVPRGQLEQQAWEQRSSHFLAPEGSVGSLLPSAKRAPGPAPRARAREEAAAGSRGPRRRRAPSSAAKRPAAAARRRSLARSLPPWLGPFVRPSVRGALPPPPPPPPPPPLQPRLGSASPPRRPARGLAGSRAPLLAPCPRRCRRRAERSPAGHGLPGEVPLPKGEAVGARRGRGGEESPGAAAARLRPRLPADPRRRSGSRPGSRARAARQRREIGGGPGGSPREGAQGEGV
ncbi:basic proline-rich protein-like [Ursus americanus]|uniref:basic proline-rich protein-like n=1 Tax=Ursus americanus TaxID=9643 RepID=UPI001E67C72C|nr:basic proline-rich protein-like [Ursus americanus]